MALVLKCFFGSLVAELAGVALAAGALYLYWGVITKGEKDSCNV